MPKVTQLLRRLTTSPAFLPTARGTQTFLQAVSISEQKLLFQVGIPALCFPPAPSPRGPLGPRCPSLQSTLVMGELPPEIQRYASGPCCPVCEVEKVPPDGVSVPSPPYGQVFGLGPSHVTPEKGLLRPRGALIGLEWGFHSSWPGIVVQAPSSLGSEIQRAGGP